MPKKLRWRRSPTGSDGKPWQNWRRSRNRIRCWPGTESSSPANSTDRSFANPGVVPELTRKPSGWWGYDRIVGAMANLGLRLSDQTVGNILRRHDVPPAPQRKQATSWKDFIRAHMAVLATTGDGGHFDSMLRCCSLFYWCPLTRNTLPLTVGHLHLRRRGAWNVSRISGVPMVAKRWGSVRSEQQRVSSQLFRPLLGANLRGGDRLYSPVPRKADTHVPELTPRSIRASFCRASRLK